MGVFNFSVPESDLPPSPPAEWEEELPVHEKVSSAHHTAHRKLHPLNTTRPIKLWREKPLFTEKNLPFRLTIGIYE